jgi:hypothetical protein
MWKTTCMVMIDGYRRGWALRYLREAKAELAAAQKIPAMAPNLILEAMRKAQVAIYYTLGEPAFIETIVLQTAGKKQAINDPILRCLVDIERTIQEFSQTEEVEINKAIRHGDDMVKMASEIVELLTDEKQD